MTSKEQNAAAERERKARIKRAHARLDALPPDDRAAVIEAAESKEAAARDAGSRRAHVAFVEDALVAWEIGGRAIAAAESGKPLDTAAIQRMVQQVSKEIRGDVGSPELREEVLEEVGRRGAHARQQGAVDAAAAAVPEQAAAAATGDVRQEALRLRGQGLTVAEVAKQMGVTASAVRELIGDAPAGKGKAGTGGEKATRARKARETRGTGAAREEKCPECGEWRPAQQDESGAYLKESDYRAGRGDCRACYNRRWLEGKARRAAKAGT